MIGDCFQSIFFPGSFTKFMAWCFPANFAKFLRTPFLQNTFRRLPRHFLSANEIVFFSWYWQKLIQNMDIGKPSFVSIYEVLREKCPNSEWSLWLTVKLCCLFSLKTVSSMLTLWACAHLPTIEKQFIVGISHLVRKPSFRKN